MVNTNLQSEAAECGLASLAPVADAHGLRIGLNEMRRRFPVSIRGAKVSQLIHIAQQLGFSTRPLRLDLEGFDNLKLPCILHWDLNHFVVLVKAGRSKVTIFDPAVGERTLSLTEVSDHFTGVALELSPTAGVQSAEGHVIAAQHKSYSTARTCPLRSTISALRSFMPVRLSQADLFAEPA